MQTEVIVVFDIGKSNKKMLLFDSEYTILKENEQSFDEIEDDDKFPCDDIQKIENWIIETLNSILESSKYKVLAINFSTYGATLVYLDDKKKRLTPLYNYLKTMPEGIFEGFYNKYGGMNEFSRITASPPMGMLNSGLQILWLKLTKPQIYNQIKYILHFPQYLSFLLSGKITSELTSIGCHTGMWNFDKQCYHRWLNDENIFLPEPVKNEFFTQIEMKGHKINIGVGIHDSSASLVPYLKQNREKFILISTGTWCVFMNPFNDEPLTDEQLSKDTLCYMSAGQKQVKSSRLFLGHIHKVNAERLSKHYLVSDEAYKSVKCNAAIINKINNIAHSRIFLRNGIPKDYIDSDVDLSIFSNYEEAYHQLISDLVDLSDNALKLIINKTDDVKNIFITGGFAKNELYIEFLKIRNPDKQIITSEIYNSSALGAAMIVGNQVFKN